MASPLISSPRPDQSNSHPSDPRYPSLQPRAVQTQALCLDKFAWMSNSKNQSPCLVVAYLTAPCYAGDWNVPALGSASVHYTPPSAINANRCQCSWAVYNLMQACAFCQGEDYYSAILGWNGWNTNCTPNVMSRPDPYPKDVPIHDATGIPYFAIVDPSTWDSAVFDPAVAQQLATESRPDLTESNRSTSNSSSTSNTAAIAGGVAGGVALLLITFVVIYYARRGRRSRIHLSEDIMSISAVESPPISPFTWFGASRRGKTHQRWDSRGSQSMLCSSPTSATSRSSRTDMHSAMAVGSLTTASLALAGSVIELDDLRFPAFGHEGLGAAQDRFLTQQYRQSASHTSPLPYGPTLSSTIVDPTHSNIPSIMPYHLSPISHLPEPHDDNTDAQACTIARVNKVSTVTSSGVLMEHPVHKERRNPPAYSSMPSTVELPFVMHGHNLIQTQCGTGGASAGSSDLNNQDLDSTDNSGTLETKVGPSLGTMESGTVVGSGGGAGIGFSAVENDMGLQGVADERSRNTGRH